MQIRCRRHQGVHMTVRDILKSKAAASYTVPPEYGSSGSAATSCSRRALLKGLVLLASAASWEASAGGDLVFGHIGAHSGVQANTGIDLRNGLSLYFDLVNANGGVKGQRLVLEAIDDEYKPDKTVEAARKLEANQKVIALLATLGTENNDALIK